MKKADREWVVKEFTRFMEENRRAYHEDIWETTDHRPHSWFMQTPFGPVWVSLEEPETHREGFSLFCQLVIWPSYWPNPRFKWYQWNHWKQNSHPENTPDRDALLMHFRNHVMRFFSYHEGKPSQEELTGLMLRKAAKSESTARQLARYHHHYHEEGLDLPAPPEVPRKSTVEPVEGADVEGSLPGSEAQPADAST